MYKSYSLSILLVTTIGLITPLNSSLPLAQAQEPQVTWDNVVQGALKREKPPLGGRGDFCPIAPYKQANQVPVLVWNDRPLFVWQGNYRSIGVREKGTQQVLGRGRASSEPTPLRWQYTGIALQPGKSYEWLFFFSQSSTSPLSWVPFKVMDTKSRNPITTDLNKLVAKLKAEGANQEEIALQRANYFAQRQLWADVLQEVYSVNNPSEQLQQVAQEIEAQACQSKK